MCVCLSVHEGEALVTITHDALALTVQGLPSSSLDIGPHGTPLLQGLTTASDIWWSVNTWDLFKVVHLRALPEVTSGDTYGRCKRAVRILVGCFLVLLVFWWYSKWIKLNLWRSYQNATPGYFSLHFRKLWTNANVFPVFYVTISWETCPVVFTKFYYFSVSFPSKQKWSVSKYSNMEFNLAETFSPLKGFHCFWLM